MYALLLRRLIFALFILSIAGEQSQAQIQPEFTANFVSGCAPLEVTFSDKSTGNIVSRTWTFGNGNSSSGNNLSPSAIYSDTGKFTVSLTVSDGSVSKTITKPFYISVHASPKADFTGGPVLAGCLPLTVNFTDKSVKAGAGIKSRYWDFGDGGNSTQQDPSYTYNLQSSFPVILTVVDSNGCRDTRIKETYIRTSTRPAVDFSSPAPSGCGTPFTVSFQNNSSGYGALNYKWDFGDNQASGASSPSHTYNSLGTYSVKLVASDINGCSDSLTRYDYVSVTTINMNQGFWFPKDSVCPGVKVNFTQYSTGGKNYEWQFGDGKKASTYHASHVFTTSGDKYVKLIVSNGPNCKDSVVRKIHVDFLAAYFEQDKRYSCEPPLTVNHTDKSVNAVSWQWIFGNKERFNGKYPPPQTYNQVKVYRDTLVITNHHGCKTIHVSTINISKMRPAIAIDTLTPPSGCAPLSVNIWNFSTPVDTIKKWEWNFGDGGTYNGRFPGSHTYVDTGIFKMTLLVTNSSGCIDTAAAYVRVGMRPQGDFTYSPVSACASDTFSFMGNAMPQNTGYAWQLGKEYIPGKKITYRFRETGYPEVTMVMSHHGCMNYVHKPKIVNVKGPVITVDHKIGLYTPVCEKKLTYKFHAFIKDAKSYYWDFGDGTRVYNTEQVTHKFPSSGEYYCGLYAFNPETGCQDSLSFTFRATDRTAVIHADTTMGCPPLKVFFHPFNSIDAWKHHWDFGNGKTSLSDTVVWSTFTKSSTRVKLIIKDIYFCEDTAWLDIRTYKPLADFKSDKTEGCDPLTVNFTDITSDIPGIVYRKWDFGGGIYDYTKNPVRTYSSVGYYPVTLTVRNAYGCSDTVSRNNYIKVEPPLPEFRTRTLTCAGDTNLFIPLHKKPGQTYLWDFGNGKTSPAEEPVHIFPDSGNYDVSLTIGRFGCTRTRKERINVQRYPVPEISADSVTIEGRSLPAVSLNPISGTCYPMTVHFKPAGKLSNVESYTWKLGIEGAISNFMKPSFSYPKPGEYDLELSVNTGNGCMSAVKRKSMVVVKGPVAGIEAVPPICLGVPVKFIAKEPSNAANFRWDFGDGQLESGETAFHTYSKTGKVFPLLVYSNKDGSCVKQKRDTIVISNIVADFRVSDSVVCRNQPLSLSDRSTIIPPAEMEYYVWEVHPGTKPFFQKTLSGVKFDKDGWNDIRLQVKSAAGCRDTVSKRVFVNPLPEILLRDTLICKGQNIRLRQGTSGHGPFTFTWTSAGAVIDSVPAPVVKPGHTTEYTLTAVDRNRCTASRSATVRVQQPPSTPRRQDTTVVIGELTRFSADAGDGFRYTWTPEKYLSCYNCPSPEGKPLENTAYKVLIEDTNGCFSREAFVNVNIMKQYSVDVPSAFSPNGDGHNDLIFVKGWGIKKLVEFKIFNRWGELVFFTDDINQGWDGYYKGKLQNVESYAYSVVVETYEGKQLTTKGLINLLR
jgi:gliding motility-associated-like protein